MDHIRTFKCITCDQILDGSKTAIDHLKIVHAIDSPKGTKQMILHMDGRDWYQSNYLWLFGEIEMLEIRISKRIKVNTIL